MFKFNLNFKKISKYLFHSLLDNRCFIKQMKEYVLLILFILIILILFFIVYYYHFLFKQKPIDNDILPDSTKPIKQDYIQKPTREILFNYIKRYEDSKDLLYIEKKIHRFYLKYIPSQYRYIDYEKGIKHPLPFWLEQFINLIKDPLLWIFILFLILSLSVLIYHFFIFIPPSQETENLILCIHNNDYNTCLIEENYIINNIESIYNFSISDEGIKNIIENSTYSNDSNITFYSNSNDLIIYTKILNNKGEENFEFLNLTLIEKFLFKWQKNSIRVENISNDLTFCFCPIFIGLKNNNIHFIFNENDKKWKILFNPSIINNDLWSNNKLTKTIITYHDKLQNLNGNLTKWKFIEHSKTLSINYDIFKIENINESGNYSKFFNLTKIKNKEQHKMIIYLKDTACFIHCQKINKF